MKMSNGVRDNIWKIFSPPTLIEGFLPIKFNFYYFCKKSQGYNKILVQPLICTFLVLWALPLKLEWCSQECLKRWSIPKKKRVNEMAHYNKISLQTTLILMAVSCQVSRLFILNGSTFWFCLDLGCLVQSWLLDVKKNTIWTPSRSKTWFSSKGEYNMSSSHFTLGRQKSIKKWRWWFTSQWI